MRLLTIALTLTLPNLVLADDATKSGIRVDPATKTVRIDAKVAPRKLPNLDKEYPIEVIASWGHEKKGKKSHETVITFDVNPSEVQKALESIGLKAGKPAKGEGAKAAGAEVIVYLELKNPDGTFKKLPIHRVLIDPKTKRPLPKDVKFVFTGSVMSQPDPNKPEKVFGADLSGTLIALFPVTDETVLQTSLTMKEEPYLKLDTNKDLLPKEGTPIVLVIEASGK